MKETHRLIKTSHWWLKVELQKCLSRDSAGLCQFRRLKTQWCICVTCFLEITSMIKGPVLTRAPSMRSRAQTMWSSYTGAATVVLDHVWLSVSLPDDKIVGKQINSSVLLVTSPLSVSLLFHRLPKATSSCLTYWVAGMTSISMSLSIQSECNTHTHTQTHSYMLM